MALLRIQSICYSTAMKLQSILGSLFDAALIMAICQNESGDPKDPSVDFHAMAYRREPRLGTASYGVMQVLLTTARGLGFKNYPDDLFDPSVCVEYGMKYLAQCHSTLSASLGRAPTLVEWVASYNAGAEGVIRHGIINPEYVYSVLTARGLWAQALLAEEGAK